MSGNQFQAKQAASLHYRLQAYRHCQLRVPYRMCQLMSEHFEIIAAIAADNEPCCVL